MKRITTISLIVFTAMVFFNCNTAKKAIDPVNYEHIINVQNGQEMMISLERGKSFNHPTYVIWMEDMMGKYIKTLFITESYASGIFGHQMVGDSIWLKTKGESYQPAALPYWTYKKGLLANNQLIPTPDHPFVDAYTGATPKGNMNFTTQFNNELPFRILFEVNQPWDWDNYWTNNKYPDSPAYEHSAQPSVVYGVTVDDSSDIFYLNPVGHGDPKGSSGKLFTNLKTLSSASSIINSISIQLKK